MGYKIPTLRTIRPNPLREDTTNNKPNRYDCDMCTKLFKSPQSLKNHKSKFHSNSYSHLCEFCEYKNKKYISLVTHQLKKHPNLHEFKVASFGDNKSAMSYFEKAVNTGKYSFKKDTGTKKNKYGPIDYYKCNFKGNGKGMGCKGFILLQKYNKSKNVKIILNSKHGHAVNLDRIRISKDLRNTLISLLTNGAELDTLHSDITAFEDPTRIGKAHCITKNFLRSLRTEVKKLKRFSNEDLENTYMVLNSLKTKSKITTFIFKEKGVKIINHPDIDDNFIVAFQTAIQHTTFIKEQSDYIMVDSTHSTNMYGYKLITFAILTRKQRFYPFIFMLSDSDSESTISYVLETLKTQDLLPSTPSYIMSDMAHTYYNSWKNNINDNIIWYYCNFHFVTAIRKKMVLKIKNLDIRTTIEKKFDSLLIIINRAKFNRAYKAFLYFIRTRAQLFYDYFFNTYHNAVERWALCYILEIELNKNNHIESYHRVLKDEHLKKNSYNRLDTVISALINYDNKLYRNSILCNYSDNLEFLGYREKQALKKHKLSQTLDESKFKLRDGSYYYKKYKITSGKCKQCDTDCQFLCRLCRICKDRFTCTCLTYLLKKKMCKHIHKVCSIVNNKTPQRPYSRSNNQGPTTQESVYNALKTEENSYKIDEQHAIMIAPEVSTNEMTNYTPPCQNIDTTPSVATSSNHPEEIVGKLLNTPKEHSITNRESKGNHKIEEKDENRIENSRMSFEDD